MLSTADMAAHAHLSLVGKCHRILSETWVRSLDRIYKLINQINTEHFAHRASRGGSGRLIQIKQSRAFTIKLMLGFA